MSETIRLTINAANSNIAIATPSINDLTPCLIFMERPPITNDNKEISKNVNFGDDPIEMKHSGGFIEIVVPDEDTLKLLETCIVQMRQIFILAKSRGN